MIKKIPKLQMQKKEKRKSKKMCVKKGQVNKVKHVLEVN